MNQESTGVNYSLALKNFIQNGRGSSARMRVMTTTNSCNTHARGRRSSVSSKMQTRTSQSRHSFLLSWNQVLPVRWVLQKYEFVLRTEWNSSRATLMWQEPRAFHTT